MSPGLPGDESGPAPGESAASATPPQDTPPTAQARPAPPITQVEPVVLAAGARAAAVAGGVLAGAVRAGALLGGSDPADRRAAEPGASASGAPAVREAGSSPAGVPGEPGVRRIEGLLLGLAAGDAAGWPAARHRAARMPEWTRRLTRELDTFAEQNATTTLPVPIALNQPPEPLRLGPSDDAEWAAFAAEAVLRAGETTALGDLSLGRRMRASIDLSWNAVASEVAAAADRAPEVESALLPLRARISVRAGLGNLATGLRPPATGHDNPHYFDDAACVRACVLAVAHPGDPDSPRNSPSSTPATPRTATGCTAPAPWPPPWRSPSPGTTSAPAWRRP